MTGLPIPGDAVAALCLGLGHYDLSPKHDPNPTTCLAATQIIRALAPLLHAAWADRPEQVAGPAAAGSAEAAPLVSLVGSLPGVRRQVVDVAEVDVLRAQLAAVARVHYQAVPGLTAWCAHCSRDWPCPTVNAIEGKSC